MDQLEEFEMYYLLQKEEEKNICINLVEQNEELINEEKEKENKVINSEQEEIKKKNKLKESTSKRLSSLTKNYCTYKIDYKKKIVMEVNKLLIVLL